MPDQNPDIMPDSPVKYIDRTRAYYLSQGFPTPYEWAENSDIAFMPVSKPLEKSRLALITTAMPMNTIGKKRKLHIRDRQPAPTQLHTDDVAWDKETTHTNDIDSFFPLKHLLELVEEKRLGSIADQFYSVPTLFSQEHTTCIDAPEILKGLQADNVDIALLVPL